MRKHERLIAVTVQPKILNIIEPGGNPTDALAVGIRRLENQTTLFELPANAPKPEVQLLMHIIFSEMGLGIVNQPVIPTLREFACHTEAIIEVFDLP